MSTAKPRKEAVVRPNYNTWQNTVYVLRGAWRRNSDRLFKILLVIFAVLILVALITLLGQLIFGDSILFRLFENKFRVIGTEKLG